VLEAGDRAPLFTLPDQNGDKVALKDFRGRPVVVYFYPKDATPGCTTQACGVRDHWAEFEAAGAVVLGISPDDVASHAKFAAKHDLPQTLLADPSKTVLEKYGAWGEKVLYGKKSVGVIRSTVLVGPDGRIAKVWKRVQTKTHADAVLKALADLAAS
jgi:thioredoxin-dependent peroxiredoxin